MRWAAWLCLVLAGAAQARAWDWANDPRRLVAHPVTEFAELPLTGAVPAARLPYADAQWLHFRAGIAYRWRSRDPAYAASTGPGNWALFQIQSPAREQALHMSRAALAELSPAEKYDLARGRYDYPLTRRVLDDPTVNPFADPSSGICHGTAAAMIAQEEPLAVEARNPDGIRVPFTATDIKALIGQAYASTRLHTAMLGRGCRGAPNGVPDVTGCLDVNAGAFHIALANLIGRQGQPFIAEIDAAAAVWNYPVQGYASEVIEESPPARRSAQGSTRRLRVRTTLDFAGIADVPSDDDHRPAGASTRSAAPPYRIDYWLDLDASGRILGGDWLTDTHPDYLWLATCPGFSGEFAELAQLYKTASGHRDACRLKSLPSTASTDRR
ncbi:MAG: hypothetical protein U1F26_12225 [Lysobacterales bacterium]